MASKTAKTRSIPHPVTHDLRKSDLASGACRRSGITKKRHSNSQKGPMKLEGISTGSRWNRAQKREGDGNFAGLPVALLRCGPWEGDHRKTCRAGASSELSGM